MAKLLFLWVSTLVFPLSGTHKKAHPFYTSVTEMEYNAREKSLEVTCRIFTEDFETILKKNYNTWVDLFNDSYKNAAALISAYVEKNLALSADGTPLTLKYIGYERKNEACWCYFETPCAAAPKKINVTATVLYDFSDKQFNLFHATVNGSRKSAKLNHPDSKASFEW